MFKDIVEKRKEEKNEVSDLIVFMTDGKVTAILERAKAEKLL